MYRKELLRNNHGLLGLNNYEAETSADSDNWVYFGQF